MNRLKTHFQSNNRLTELKKFSLVIGMKSDQSESQQSISTSFTQGKASKYLHRKETEYVKKKHGNIRALFPDQLWGARAINW